MATIKQFKQKKNLGLEMLCFWDRFDGKLLSRVMKAKFDKVKVYPLIPGECYEPKYDKL
jgi:hypothetical protein